MRIEPWNAISDGKLPKDGETVLCYWPAQPPYMPASYESLTYDAESGWYDVFSSADDEPTHWMPLPPAPGESLQTGRESAEDRAALARGEIPAHIALPSENRAGASPLGDPTERMRYVFERKVVEHFKAVAGKENVAGDEPNKDAEDAAKWRRLGGFGYLRKGSYTVEQWGDGGTLPPGAKRVYVECDDEPETPSQGVESDS